MTIYVRVNGVYQAVDRPFVRVNGVYTGAKQVWVRNAGTYKSAYLFDITPPDPPLITTALIETRNDKNVLTGRYIKVGVRLPGASNDPDARLVRVLTNYPASKDDDTAKPSTQYGGTYTAEPDKTYPDEPWSEWRYNAYGSHKDTSVEVFKQWYPNATTATDIVNDKTYYFTGWSVDDQGNWSVPTSAQLHVPKASVDTPPIVVKEARFQANTSGSWTSSGFQSGKLIQRDSPRSRGLWLYGNQFTDSIGKDGAPTIRSAQVFIKREDDTGVANADIHLGWTPYGTVGSLPSPGGGLTVNEIKKVGTLAKGKGDWFTIPSTFYADFNNNIKGLELNYKDYLKAAASEKDFSVIQKIADNLRCGEVHVVWEEKL
jgi:hypothetical protein